MSPCFNDLFPRRIAIFRALQLGDLLCTVPALRALRAAFPEAEIALIGLPWARAFVQRFNCYLDSFLEFPGYPGLPERAVQVQQVPAFLSTVQQLQFDLALQLHGSGGITNPLTLLFAAKQTAGFFSSGQYCPAPERFLPHPEREPEWRRPLKLLEFLGVPLQGEALEFPLFETDWRELRSLDAAQPLFALPTEPYVCIHAGARDPNRRWSPQQFAAVADVLAAQGLKIVLTGSAAEAELTQAVATAMSSPCLNLTGQTSLGALAALLKGAQLLVCNDTGVSHLAAALQVNSVVIFTGSDPKRWAPLDQQRHRILCHPTPEDLLTQANSLLHRQP
ncbi:glycosyltransferase family 9 protein [Leptolyngbya sp. FACHB-261]|nr:glycosyltransferase family 9 protein [Leptolyngbya sp. FACHB-261]